MNDGALGMFALLFLLAVVPGPSDLLVASRAVSAGWRSAVLMIVGILCADLVLILLVALSLGSLVSALGEHSDLIRLSGAGLLITFGVSALINIKSEPDAGSARSFSGSFLGGFLITFADPKAIAFYFGMLPAFFDLRTLGLGEIAVIFGIVTLVICLTKGGYVWLSIRGVSLLPNPKVKAVIHILAGWVMIGIGVSMVLK